ncbi:exodeoxyribonuclease V subunit gamma [Bradymonas sediminis]|uniref:RecC C-terminal domain-containing protein n=1 Tax=Bradymonas sediminis TaxID=1548548 RepID=A0A2Z4FG14_9DELT|nr:exodeoxyribonuclease V subunit gamma [Bradymonas sediminis]AWV87860.1 hypothetical protein DN745_00350 [Bradymonas sediminis]TDP62873.1 DNA helicase/exodeoxyribonuclease V gamma subunit [Bradymonas sediminis]
MLQVWYSNSLDRLVDGLVEVEATERKNLGLNPIERSPVVVPGANMGTYLKYAVATRAGIAGRIEPWHIGDFFDALLPDDSSFQTLNASKIQVLLLDIFEDEALLGAPELKEPRDYLAMSNAERSSDSDTRALRRFQLSGHIAQLFEEYHLNRPKMLLEWLEAEPGDAAPEGASLTEFERTERWQRALWLLLFGEGGRIERLAEETGVRYLRPDQIFDRVPPGRLRLPPVIQFFALDRVGGVYEKLLGQLGELTRVHIWALNPCIEFWEDVLTDFDEESHLLSSARSAPSTPGQADLLAPMIDETFWEPERFPLPLRLWGRAGRDQMRMYNRLCGYDPRMEFVDAEDEQPTVLKQLQRDVLKLQYERSEPMARFAASDAVDESITVFACSGVQREVETIANEIWRLMRADPTLQFNEIALILGREQSAAYQTQVEAVFQQVHGIPYNIIDIDSTGAGRVFEALDLLFELPFGDLRRRDLLRLLTHPNVIAKFSDIDPDVWLRWCDDLHIVHGADHHDHEESYIEQDLYNWDQGLKRLVLGGFMTGAPSGDERIYGGAGFEYLPHEIAHGDAESAAIFVRTARALIRDSRRFKVEKRTLRAWFDELASLIQRYLGAETDADDADLRLCLATLSELADMPPPEDAPRKVSYRIAREFVRREMGKMSGNRGQYLIDGVSVSAFMPARPMPFRVIFCAGMGEATFPSSEPVDPLDLRREKWVEGDASRRDLDKYAFFQALMAARERIYLSYIARDSRTGEGLEPSSVVQDLMRMVAQQYMGQERADARVLAQPLRRYHPGYFPQLRDDDASEPLDLGPNFHPEARLEASALALRDSLVEHLEHYPNRAASAGMLNAGFEFPEVAHLLDVVDTPTRELLNRVLGTYRLSGAKGPSRDLREVSISLTQLRQFLESPLQTSARWSLGMRGDEDEDLLAVDDEIFEASYVESLMLMRDVFERTLTDPRGGRDASQLEAAYDSRARFLELQGVLPTGVFFREARNRHLDALAIWQANLGHFRIPTDTPLELRSFGRARKRVQGGQSLDSIRFDVELPEPATGDVQRVRVEVSGVSELLAKDATMAVTPVLRTSAKEKDFLRGFLSQVALAAAGEGDENAPFEAIVLPGKAIEKPKSQQKFRMQFAPISQPDAIAYLKALSVDFLSGVHANTMPIEAVFDYFKPDNEVSFADLVEKQFANTWSSCSEEYGPVRQPSRFPAPPNAEAILARRFEPFFSRVLAEKEDA